MTSLTNRIEQLSGAQAVRVLTTIAQAHLTRGAAAPLVPEPYLLADLSATIDTIPAEASVSDAEMAKATLHLLAAEPATASVLDHLTEHPPAESFSIDPVTLSIGVATLIVLQSYIQFERTSSGKWVFKFEKQPMSNSLLKDVISKLSAWTRG